MMAPVRPSKTKLELQIEKIALELSLESNSPDIDVSSILRPTNPSLSSSSMSSSSSSSSSWSAAAASLSSLQISNSNSQNSSSPSNPQQTRPHNPPPHLNNGGGRQQPRQRQTPQQPNATYSLMLTREFTNKNMFVADPNQDPITTKQPPEEVFEFLDDLGHGSSGNVLKMRHIQTGIVCAVKQIRRSGNEEENKRIYFDLQTVLDCQCDHIVRCYGYFIKEMEVWICTELMTTCLEKMMKKRQNRPLPEKFLGAVAVSTLKALDYLKERNQIIHRDVKPSNILINDEAQIKLCDFGISGKLINSQAKTRTAGCMWYMAPERFEEQKYDVRSDVWSLGMTLYELATGHAIFANLQDFEVMSRIMLDPPPELPKDADFSDEFRHFMERCLTKDYKQRPKFKELIEDKFIQRHMNTRVRLNELD